MVGRARYGALPSGGDPRGFSQVRCLGLPTPLGVDKHANVIYPAGMEKRKISYEQDVALAHGRQVARSNQRRRVAANQAAERAREDRDREMREHMERGLHGWKNWEYDFDSLTETRVCRDCGLAETRPIKW